ncbi:MAG: hypothetical protein GX447_04205 [Elusimicrobia bacterium]|nr:hypothetical protein [Elusimicrobiota bacterium]
MRAFFGIIFFVLSVFPFSYAAQYKGGELFEIDFDGGWEQGKSNDPAVLLRLEKGQNFLEISKLEDELSDYYLKSRLKEQAETFKNKGEAISEPKSASVHGSGASYYAVSGENIIALLTYGGVSYSLISKGVSEGKIKDVIYFFRKPGEKVEKPKPKPAPKRKVKEEKEEEKTEGVQYFMVEDSSGQASTQAPVFVFTDTSASQIQTSQTQTQVSTSPSAAEQMQKNALNLLTELAARDYSAKPIFQRKPINKFAVMGIISFWLIGWLFSVAKYSSVPNPKMTPYPQEVPPDFFFPFIISRVRTPKTAMFHIITRQKQVLSGFYNHEFQPILSAGVYGLIAFHIFWSMTGFINENMVIGTLASLPLGKYIASLPEFPFVLLIIYGLIKKSQTLQKLYVQDAQTNPVMSVMPDKKYYAIMKDGKGKEVAQLHQRNDGSVRKWHFVDTDNQVVFTIVDEHPEIYKAIRLFGNPTGALRCRYSIFVDNKRAGFLFVDMNSPDGFQVHLEYAYARLAHPGQIMSALLYIASREKEKSFFNL